MRRALLILAVVLFIPAVASASQIAVGLDWQHNVFVQEFWQDGKPRYAIYNGRRDPIKLTVTDLQFVNVPGKESFQAVEGKELASWEIKEKAVVFVDAPRVAGNDGLRFLRFRLAEGARLGVLSVPAPPADLPRGKIVSCDGINGSGGRRQQVCYEQDSLTFKSGATVEVTLTLPAGNETVTFKKKKGLDNPVEALISEVECATLPIQAGRDEFKIDLSKPLKAADVHRVTLRFPAPRMDAPTMLVIDGWVSIPSTIPGQTGGGYHVVRGVIVEKGS